MVSDELVGTRTRTQVREMMSETVLREIDSLWNAEGFTTYEDIEPVGGQRVTRFEAYMRTVDWTSHTEARRALNVFEEALISVREGWASTHIEYWEQAFHRVRRAAERDGLGLSDDLRFTIPVEPISIESLDALPDPAAVQAGLSRLDSAVRSGDHELAIGGAKEVVESTARLVLTQLGADADEIMKLDLPRLVKRAQAALGLAPNDGHRHPDHLQATRQILNGAIGVASGLAELRNAYGTGHGPVQPRSGLSARHARLAVNAARLWCDLALDTLADPAAPWRLSDAHNGRNH